MVIVTNCRASRSSFIPCSTGNRAQTRTGVKAELAAASQQWLVWVKMEDQRETSQ